MPDSLQAPVFKTFEEYSNTVAIYESSPAIFMRQFVSAPEPWTPHPTVAGHIDIFEAPTCLFNIDLVRLQHGVEGLVTEAGELLEAWHVHRHEKQKVDMTNIIEELGDMWWYVAVLARTFYGYTPVEYVIDAQCARPRKTGELVDNLCTSAIRLLDYLKKRKFYPRGVVVEKFSGNLARTVDILVDLCYAFGSTPLDVMNANARKLASRYQAKAFTTECANDRDVHQEMASMMAVESTPGVTGESTRTIDPVNCASGLVVVHEDSGLVAPDAGYITSVTAAHYASMHPSKVWVDGVGFQDPPTALETVRPIESEKHI